MTATVKNTLGVPTRRDLVAGMGAVAAMPLTACSSRPSWQVRLLCTITATVGGKVYANGTVLDLKYWSNGRGPEEFRWKHHVPYCDLGPHGLLVWDRNGGSVADENHLGFHRVHETYGLELFRENYAAVESRLRNVTEPLPVNLEPRSNRQRTSKIGLVHIWDRQLRPRKVVTVGEVVQNGARRKSVQELRTEGIDVTSITYQTTAASLTNVIYKLLPNLGTELNYAISQDGNTPTNQQLRVGHLVGQL